MWLAVIVLAVLGLLEFLVRAILLLLVMTFGEGADFIVPFLWKTMAEIARQR